MDEQSQWKREVSFSRKPDENADETPATDDAPVVEETPAAEEQQNEKETLWKREVSFNRAAETEAEAPEPVADEPQAEEEQVEEEQLWQRAVSFTPTTDPEPEAEPEPDVAAQETVVVEEPVAEANVPFWKKEISFGGGKKKREPKEPKVKAEAGESVPFWKKDISLGGGKKKREQAPKTPKEPKVKAEAGESVPFWKKDISFGGGKKTAAEKPPKEPKAAKQPKERKPKEPKVKAARGGAKGRVVGLKIGASQLAAARVVNNGTAELQQVAREPLASGIVVGGELRDADALAEALKEFFAKHKLPKRGVRLGIANNRIGVRTFEIVGISDAKQLTNAIRFRAQEALPIPIDEAVLDFHVLGEGVDDEGQPTSRVLLVVAYRELIDRYVDACRKAGIQLSGIDLEAFALLRAIQAPQDGVGNDASAALVAVSIGHERSTFAVSDGRVCEFTRVLEWGGGALNVALARVLDAAPSEVEDIKHELTLTDSTVPEGLTAEQATRCVEALRKAIQAFARELVSSLQYYQNQPGSLGIGEIVITGGTAHLPGLAGELERLIGVRVRVANPLARMKVAKRVGEPHQVGSLAVAIGLGIED